MIQALRARMSARTNQLATNLPPVSVPIAKPQASTPSAAATTPPAPPGGVTVAPSAAAPAAVPPAPVAPVAASTPAAAAPAAAATLTNAPKAADQTIAIPPSTQATNLAPEELIPAGMIDFRGVDLAQVLKVYAELVNRTVLRPGNLAAQQQIFLTSQTPLTKREAMQALDAVLGINGVAMINVGDKFVKAVPTQTANTEGAAFNKLTVEQLPDLGQYVTHVVQLKYTRPSELVPVLTPFAKIPTAVLPIESSQIIVLRDFAENVKRMLEMIDKIDVAIPSEFVSEVIPIKYAKASEIAAALNSLSTGGGGATVGGGAGGGGMTSSLRGGSRMGTMGRPGMGTMGGYPGTMGAMGATPFGATTPGTTPGAAPATGASFTDRLRNIISKASASGEIQVLGQTKMIADERSNSLLIFASREDMKMIKEIVAKLDVVLAQVLIEAVVIQVTLGNDRDIGFSYLSRAQNAGDFTGVGAIRTGTTPFSQFGDFVQGGGTNVLLGGFNYLARFNNDLDVTISAVQQDNRARILQRPTIQTSHNETAHLFVGESRPYPTASYYGGGAYGGYSSIQQVPIGVTLDVTPLINPDGLVVMEINQDIQSASGFVDIANVGQVPITSQKSAYAKVSVRDRDTIMLGGLIETSKSKSGSGVPILMDIPGLGFFFRSTSVKDVRNEMIVLIRPTVLPTPEVAALTARAVKDKMPGVSRAESDLTADEQKLQKKADKAREKR
jgi:general secretion pathway protein D